MTLAIVAQGETPGYTSVLICERQEESVGQAGAMQTDLITGEVDAF